MLSSAYKTHYYCHKNYAQQQIEFPAEDIAPLRHKNR